MWRLRHRLEYLALRGALWMFGALSRPLALRLGALVGSILYLLDRPHRRVALKNLSIAFPEKNARERLEILHRSCRNLGRMAAEFCHLHSLTRESIERYVRVEDPEAWRAALAVAERRGAIILTGHFGNWELLAYAHGLLGYPVTLIHRPFRNRFVDHLIDAIRRKAGTRTVAKKAAAKEAIRSLARRELLVVPADQNQTRRFGVFVSFFGLTASTTPGPARLAMRTGAAVYPAFLVREGESERHRIVLLPEVEMTRTDDRNADIVTNTQRCTAVIEEMLRQHPDHWIWFHKRWRTRPPGEPKIY
jgi:KDO2-lipid IV(A) lauroyltransferase